MKPRGTWNGNKDFLPSLMLKLFRVVSHASFHRLFFVCLSSREGGSSPSDRWKTEVPGRGRCAQSFVDEEAQTSSV